MARIEATLESLSQKMSGVRWHGRYFSACCPWHDDKHSSLMVYEDGAFCMACRKRASFDMLTRILYKRKRTKPRSFSEIELAEFRWNTAPPPEDLADGASDLLSKFKEMGSYLVERGIESRIEPNRLGWWGGYFTFPIFDRDDVFQRLVLRAGPETERISGTRYIISPGAGDCLYMPDPPLVNSAKKVFVVFGILLPLSACVLDEHFQSFVCRIAIVNSVVSNKTFVIKFHSQSAEEISQRHSCCMYMYHSTFSGTGLDMDVPGPDVVLRAERSDCLAVQKNCDVCVYVRGSLRANLRWSCECPDKAVD